MPHDPARIADARPWLQKASEDLRAGTFELSATPPLFSDIVFHAQQAAEKAMKGFLAWHETGHSARPTIGSNSAALALQSPPILSPFCARLRR